MYHGWILSGSSRAVVLFVALILSQSDKSLSFPSPQPSFRIQVPLAQITKAALHNEFTVFCGFSAYECARYMETFKSYENKPAESIQKDLGTDYGGRVTAVLTGVRGVNKTDVKSLVCDGRSLSDVMQMDLETLQSVPGIGPTKARRLFEAFDRPFYGR